MDLFFNFSKADGYHSSSQRIRKLSEDWVETNMYCPRCGAMSIFCFPNNQSVADFFCVKCKSQFELKSKKGNIANIIPGGSYEKMINRIGSDTNPDFFFLSYDKQTVCVKSFIIVPKHFIVPDLIAQRKALSPEARRAGWIGCNILFHLIPEQGRIFAINNGTILNKEGVVAQMNRAYSIKTKNIESRSWLNDILNCVDSFGSNAFTLQQIYQFENILSNKHPNNNNIRAKIRQQLQLLRDNGFIEFSGKGIYRKI